MRIVLDARILNRHQTGMGRYAKNLILNLMKVDSDNEYILVMRSKQDYPEIDNSNFQSYEVKQNPFSWKTSREIVRICKRFNADLFHSLYYLAPPGLKCATIITIYDLIPVKYPELYTESVGLARSLKSLIYRRLLKNSIGRANAVVTTSECTRKDLQDFGTPEEKILIIYPGTDCAFLKTGKTHMDTGSVLFDSNAKIVFVGNGRGYKNVRKLVSAYRLLRKEYKTNLELILIGAGIQKALNHGFADIDLKEIKILETADDQQLRTLFESASLFVFPSLYEGFGMPPLEAMACGVPVVASDRASLPEVLGDAAHYVNPDEERDIARGMQTVLLDTNLRKTMIEKGFEQVKKYSWAKTAREMLQVYNDVYNKGKLN